MGIIFHIDVNSAYLSWTAVKLLKEAAKDGKENRHTKYSCHHRR